MAARWSCVNFMLTFLWSKRVSSCNNDGLECDLSICCMPNNIEEMKFERVYHPTYWSWGREAVLLAFVAETEVWPCPFMVKYWGECKLHMDSGTTFFVSFCLMHTIKWDSSLPWDLLDATVHLYQCSIAWEVYKLRIYTNENLYVKCLDSFLPSYSSVKKKLRVCLY